MKKNDLFYSLSIKGHAYPLEFLKKFNVPLILLGGGGYTIRNVARAWTYETAMALGEQDRVLEGKKNLILIHDHILN